MKERAAGVGADWPGLRRWLKSRFPSGVLYMVGAAFFFSLMSASVKLAGQTLPTLQVVLARGLVLVAFTWLLLRRAGLDPWGERRGLLLLRGGLGFAALICFYYAVIHLPLADATVIQYTNPVWTALIAAVALDERLRRWEVAGTVASLVGVVLIARPTFLFGAGPRALDPVNVGIALAGAVFSASAYVTVRKLGSTEDPLVIVFYFALVNALAAIPLSAPVLEMPTGPEWAALVAVGLTAQVAQVLMTEALKRERAGRTMAVGYLQIVFAAIWGALLFDEMPDLWMAGGALLVMGGTFVTGRRKEPAGAGPG